MYLLDFMQKKRTGSKIKGFSENLGKVNRKFDIDRIGDFNVYRYGLGTAY